MSVILLSKRPMPVECRRTDDNDKACVKTVLCIDLTAYQNTYSA
jgi:hypothetical protein